MDGFIDSDRKRNQSLQPGQLLLTGVAQWLFQAIDRQIGAVNEKLFSISLRPRQICIETKFRTAWQAIAQLPQTDDLILPLANADLYFQDGKSAFQSCRN